MSNQDTGWKQANEFTEPPFNYVHALMFLLCLVGVVFVVAYLLPLWMG